MFVILCTYVLTRGTQESNAFNYVFTMAKLVTMVIIIAAGFSHFNIENFTPFFEEEHGFSGTVFGATIIFFAYLGFDFITTLSYEAKNPVRSIPISIQSCILICTTIYVLVAVAVNGVARLD